MKLPNVLKKAALAALMTVPVSAQDFSYYQYEDKPIDPKKISYTITGGTSKFTGKTLYDFTFEKYDGALDPTYNKLNYESKLEFDLDAELANVGVEVCLDKRLSFLGSCSFSIKEGEGKTRDRDWLYNDYVNNTRGYDPLGGDTTSNTKSPILIINAGMKRKLYDKDGVSLHGLLYAENLRFGEFKVTDVKGFYRGAFTPDGNYHAVDETRTDPPLATYLVNYYSVGGGISGGLSLGDILMMEAKGSLSAGVYKDEDHHLKRNLYFEGVGSVFGIDLSGSASVRPVPFLELSAFAQYRIMSGKGEQDQYTEYGSTKTFQGTTKHTIESEQLNIGIEVSLKIGGDDPAKKKNKKKSPKKKKNKR